jgi:hypothetical protein
MRTWIALLLCAACGGSAGKPTVALPTAKLQTPERTLTERKASACAKPHLVAPERASLAERLGPASHSVVRSVVVRDRTNAAVTVPSDALAPLKVGEPYDPESGREVARRLWKTGLFDDVVIDADGDGIVFRVQARHTIAQVFISGTDPGELHVSPGTPYDPVALVANGQAFVVGQVRHGYLDGKLALSSDFADASGAIDLCIHYDPGPLVTIDSVEVRGSAHAADLSAMLAHEDTDNVRGHVPNLDVLERDDLLVSAWTYDHGLLTSNVRHELERHGDTTGIVFFVTDGAVFKYSSLDVAGDLALPKADYKKLVPQKPGDVFDRSAVLKVIEAINTMHKGLGRGDEITVEPETTLDTAKSTVAIVLRVHAPSTAGFAIKDVVIGKGRVAKKGDTASIEYTGTLTNGTVFDSSAGRGPFQFKLGGGSVIAGFERGVEGMKVGGKRRVTIPPSLGYGVNGSPPKIPGGATIIFEIELVALQ